MSSVVKTQREKSGMGRSLHWPRSYSAETREKEYGLSGAKGLGSLCKPGGKSASSREMSLF